MRAFELNHAIKLMGACLHSSLEKVNENGIFEFLPDKFNVWCIGTAEKINP